MEESQLQIKLDGLNKELDALNGELNNLNTKFYEQNLQYLEECKKGTTAVILKMYGDFFIYLLDRMKEQRALIANCESRISVCRNDLLKIMNEKKTLDKIKSEQFLEYTKELQKDNDIMLEDFFSGKY